MSRNVFVKYIKKIIKSLAARDTIYHNKFIDQKLADFLFLYVNFPDLSLIPFALAKYDFLLTISL